MSAPYRTKSEQKLEWYEHLKRPLTDAESEELQRAMHAVYCRKRKAKMLLRHRREETNLLKKVCAEYGQPQRYVER